MEHLIMSELPDMEAQVQSIPQTVFQPTIQPNVQPIVQFPFQSAAQRSIHSVGQVSVQTNGQIPIQSNTQNQIQSTDSVEHAPLFKGIVSKLIKHRNFGFIKSVEQGKTGTQEREIFFHKTAIKTSKFTPKIKQGDKCLFHLTSNEKGLLAKDITINYRPIPKNKRQQQQQANLNLNETNPKMLLFTNTMMKLFDQSTHVQDRHQPDRQHKGGWC